MKRRSWFVLTLFIAGITVSCLDEPDCFQLNNDVFGVGFKVLGFASDNVPVTKILVSGTNLIYEPTAAITGASLQLNPTADTMGFTVETPGGNLLIGVGYKRQIQFVSDECGERFIYSALNVTGTGWDSVNVINPTPTTNPSTNVELFRCGVTNQLIVTFGTAVGLASVRVAELDSTINYTAETSTSIYLPVDTPRPTPPYITRRDTTTFEFTHRDGVKRTVQIDYRAVPKIIARQCGIQFFLDEVRVLSPGYSTTTVSNNAITDPPKTNLTITP